MNDLERLEGSLPDRARLFRHAPYKFIKFYPAKAHQAHLVHQWNGALSSPDQALLAGPASLAHIRISPFDSEALGFPCASIPSFALTGADQDEANRLAKDAVSWSLDHGVRFLQVRIDARDHGAIQALEEAGFRYGDAILRSVFTLEGIAEASKGMPQPASEIRLATPQDLPTVLGVAQRIFRHSRFHRDPSFPEGAASALHQSWVSNAVLGHRGFCFLSEVEGKLAGFFTAWLDEEINPFVERKLARLELSAVLPIRRAPRIWEDMALAVYHECVKRGATLGEGRPQVYNYAIIQKQMSILPEFLRAEIALHRWS